MPFKTGQTITDSIPAQTGCDTLLSLRLDRRAAPAIFRDTMTCTNAPITIQSQTYMPGDTIIRFKPAITGCDTVVRTIYRTHLAAPLTVSVTDSVVCSRCDHSSNNLHLHKTHVEYRSYISLRPTWRGYIHGDPHRRTGMPASGASVSKVHHH
ncbi:MAG: hypothetical protein IPJ13_06565 [Saprospiraceae bacterium]|nr:hypothetical protein [Saprospiraceae bacterium]